MPQEQTKDTQEEEVVSSLAMSDEDFPDYPPGEEPQALSEAAEGPQEDDSTDEEDEDDTEQEDDSEAEEDSDNESEEDASEDSEPGSASSEGDSEEEEEATEKIDEPSGKRKSKKAKGKKGKSDATELEATATSADAQLKELFAPFRANGRDMQVSSVEDAITLMKMGANYNKKMQGLKPNLRLMKMLDNNKLLDEEKLSYLIDLDNKNPQAIAKLIKESGYDAMNYDEDNTDYTPNTYTVNDNEVDLDMVLDEIKDTPSFQKTIDTISNKWDAGSRKLVESDPEIIRVINDHISSGMYDQIMDIVQNEKSLNRLTEMSDLQAYKYVGDTLHASGAFDPPADANVKQPAKNKSQDPKLKNRKRAAANTRSKPVKKQQAFDPLSLSDEEFAKLDPALL